MAEAQPLPSPIRAPPEIPRAKTTTGMQQMNESVGVASATVAPAMPRQPKKRAAILAVGLDKPTREIMITLFARGILVSWVTVRKLQKEAGMVPIGSPRTPPGGGLVSARAARETSLPAFRTAAARLVTERGLAAARAILEEVIADVEGN